MRASSPDNQCPDDGVIAALVQGTLPPDLFRSTEQHMTECSRCADLAVAVVGRQSQTTAARVRPDAGDQPSANSSDGALAPLTQNAPALTAPAILARGTLAGRYVTLDLLGRGGMGDVYAAYDPELERKVAIKILRSDLTSHARLVEAAERMRREAKAVAKLSHPNVVVVYESGFVGERMFIAMEHVTGETIATWLKAAPRTLPEILHVFAEAGRGLAAAHAAGVVHRDFKPQNVMIGASGRVLVMDFGLALLEHDDSSEVDTDTGTDTEQDVAVPEQAGGAAVAGGATTRLTRTGALMGTPAYMAPEQLRGKPASARSDQYSFCVSLHEALYQRRPAPPGASNRDAEKEAPPPGAGAAITALRVPAWLRGVLARGLRSVPTERFPSMAELVAALETIPARRRRLRVILAAAAVSAAVAAALLFGRPAPAIEMCLTGSRQVATVWQPADAPGERREAVRQALVAAAGVRGQDIFARSAKILDQYGRAWSEMYVDACEATHKRGEQSAALLDARMTCLRRRLEDLRALTDLFTRADAMVASKAIDAALALSPLGACADTRALQAMVAPPPPELRDRVEGLRRRLAEAKALRDTGRFIDARAKGRPLVTEARQTGYKPIIAAAQLELALTTAETDDVDSISELRRAVVDGEAAGDDEVVAASAVMLVWFEAAQGKFADGRYWDAFAEAALQRIGGHERLWSWLLNHRSWQLIAEGRPSEAVAVQERSVVMMDKAVGRNHPDFAKQLNSQSACLVDSERWNEALAALDEAEPILEHTYGKATVQLAKLSNNRGEALNGLGKFADADGAFRRAVAAFEADSSADHPNISYPLTGLGLSLIGQHRYREAVAPLERAWVLRTTKPVPAMRRAETGFALADALWNGSGNRTRARRLAQAAAAAYRESPHLAAKAGAVDTWLAEHP